MKAEAEIENMKNLDDITKKLKYQGPSPLSTFLSYLTVDNALRTMPVYWGKDSFSRKSFLHNVHFYAIQCHIMLSPSFELRALAEGATAAYLCMRECFW